MKDYSVALVGYGAVGRAMHKLFPQAIPYDAPMSIGTRADVNASRYAFVAVPTPSRSDGSADTSVVDEVVGWIESEVIIIRSTVPVGTTERLCNEYGKQIVFQPEFGPAETPDHPFSDLRNVRWAIFGGERAATNAAADLYKTIFSADFVIHQTSARTAELTKYMENAFLATKVTFCNEFYDIAQAVNVDYNEMRELWLLDPRIGRSHTFVFPDNRGFGGKCLPKDLTAVIRAAEAAGLDPQLLRAVEVTNQAHRATGT